MATKLRRLVIDRVDLVDKGANPDAHIVLFKRADGPDDAPEVATPAPAAHAPVAKAEEALIPALPDEILARRETMEAWYKIHDAFLSSFHEIMAITPPADQPGLLGQAVAQFAAQAKAMAPRLRKSAEVDAVLAELEAVEKIGRKISAARMTRLKDAMEALRAIIEEDQGGEDMPEKTQKSAEELVAALTARAEAAEAQVTALTTRAETAETAVAALQGDVETLKAQVDKRDEPDDIWKGVSPEVRKRVEEAEARAAQADEVAKAERTQRLRGEYIQKAATYAPIGLVADDDWELLKAIDEVVPEPLGKRLLEILKSAAAVAKSSEAFKAIGASGTPAGSSDATAWGQIETLAKEHVAKGEAKDLADAIAKISTEQPDLYNAYRAERRARS